MRVTYACAESTSRVHFAPSLRPKSLGRILVPAFNKPVQSCHERDLSRKSSSEARYLHETPEETKARRLQESLRVDERVINVSTNEEFQREIGNAGSKLVVLEVQSDIVCQTGIEDEANVNWKADMQRNQNRCTEIKHVFLRTARECPDVKFLSLQVETGHSTDRLARSLGVEVLPTLLFYRNGVKLWQHQGAMNMQEDLGEGVLFYGDTAANGLQASDFVKQLESREAFEQFIGSKNEKVLTVLCVALTSASPCVRVYPAVLALARSFAGFAEFGRLIGDASPELQGVMASLQIKEVPTFIFYRGGKELHRHVGSSRGDLIGKILEQQAAAGISPPPAPVIKKAPRVVKKR